MNQSLTFNEVLLLSEYEPDKFIKCTNNEGTLNFLMKAIDIKNSIGNFKWEGINFNILGNTNTELDRLNYKLCYINNHKAWFTNNFKEQWRR